MTGAERVRLFRHLTPGAFAGLAVFVGISLMVVSGAIERLDTDALVWLGDHRTEAFTSLMLLVTFLGDGAVEVPLALGACVLLWKFIGSRSAMTLFGAALSGELIYVAAKAAFHRDRPEVIEQLSSAGWHSYPSGHAMLAPVIWSLLLLLLVPHLPRWLGQLLVALALVIPISIAFSRVYLGVHYPSDVLGALALGGSWMALWLAWFRSDSTSSLADTR